MSQSVFRESALLIDARSISLLLDRALQAQGIIAKVAIFDSCCHILLISHQLPHPGIVVDWVQNQLQECPFSAIDRFKIYGRQIGKKLPIWQHEFAL
jgi:hypothetical protein